MILAMKTVAQFIEENIKDLRNLYKIGIVNRKLLTDYSIYVYYKSLNSNKMPSKMDRYQFTADSLKTNVTSVRMAISQMERSMN